MYNAIDSEVPTVRAPVIRFCTHDSSFQPDPAKASLAPGRSRWTRALDTRVTVSSAVKRTLATALRAAPPTPVEPCGFRAFYGLSVED